MTAQNDDQEAYTLRMFPFSLYSIMVMYTYVLGHDSAESGTSGVKLTNYLVNLHRDENIKEEYLRDINPKGLVKYSTVEYSG